MMNMDVPVSPINPVYDHNGGKEVIELIEDYRMDFVLGNATQHIFYSSKSAPGNAAMMHNLSMALWYLERAIQQCETGKRRHYGFVPAITAKDFCESAGIEGPQAVAIELICKFSKLADVDFGNFNYILILKTAHDVIFEKIKELQ